MRRCAIRSSGIDLSLIRVIQDLPKLSLLNGQGLPISISQCLCQEVRAAIGGIFQRILNLAEPANGLHHGLKAFEVCRDNLVFIVQIIDDGFGREDVRF